MCDVIHHLRLQDGPRLSRERCAAAAVVLQKRVVVMGGCDEEGAALASVEALCAGRWEALPSMRRERCNFAAAVVAGRILVAGGYDARGLCKGVVQPVARGIQGTWTRWSSMSHAQGGRLWCTWRCPAGAFAPPAAVARSSWWVAMWGSWRWARRTAGAFG